MKFRLKTGKHYHGKEISTDDGATWGPYTPKEGVDPPQGSLIRAKCYRPGDIVESKRDLVKTLPNKFEYMHGDTPASVAPQEPVAKPKDPDPLPPDGGLVADETPDFDAMTVNQLREYAAQEEIDLDGLTYKADILEAVKAATSPTSP